MSTLKLFAGLGWTRGTQGWPASDDTTRNSSVDDFFLIQATETKQYAPTKQLNAPTKHNRIKRK